MDESVFALAGLSIFPNPANDYININMDMPHNAQIVDFTLFNALGAIQLEKRLQTNKTHLETAQLPPGIYFARIAKDGKILFTQMLVIQH